MTVIANGAKLSRLNVRPPLGEYLWLIWQRRDFILYEAKSRSFRKNQNLRLWRLWVVVNPFLEALVYGTFFGILFQSDRGIDNFVGYVVIGTTYFTLLNKMFLSGNSLIQTSRNMIRSFNFPRAILVFSQSIRYVLDTLPAAIVAIIVALLFQWDKPLSWTIILVIPLFFLLQLFGAGLMFITARLTAFFPDLKVIFELGGRAWLFTSGVFYSIDRFASRPELYQAMQINPAYVFLSAMRDVVMYATVPTWEVWLQLLAWSLGIFIGGFLLFWQAEERYVKVA